MQKVFVLFLVAAGFVACSPARQFTKAQAALVKDTALAGAHLGISIYDPAKGKYQYNYQGDKYFVPASNTKLFTCYAAMKYLGDSLVGARYKSAFNSIAIQPSGDPTFLHPDFDYQPLLELLKEKWNDVHVRLSFDIKKYGPGWSWDDYEADYMPERSCLPIYGNSVWISTNKLLPKNLTRDTVIDTALFTQHGGFISVKPAFFARTLKTEYGKKDSITFHRNTYDNNYYSVGASTNFNQQTIPFITNYGYTALNILESVINKKVTNGTIFGKGDNTIKILHSQPTDSLLKPMMHRSDNFFAEQSLLMVSNEKLGYMNDEAIIDTLLKNDLKDLPQKPVWVDGSGLSRYNEFTPQDMVTVLLKIKNEFGLERIRNILPKGNTGTLTNYYQKIGERIFAKTGSLSGQIALSGYLVCKSGKLLLFSVLVNNHNSSGRAVRRAVEKFVTQVWEKN